MSVKITGPWHGKAQNCISILRSLPQWFGVETALQAYSTEIDRLPTFLACEASHEIGFLSLKQHNRFAAEIYVMGVLPEFHRHGTGRALVEIAQQWLRHQSVEYLQVKTLGPSHPDSDYARTRAFYAAMDFRPLEEFKQIWDENNPCLILVKCLERS